MRPILIFTLSAFSLMQTGCVGAGTTPNTNSVGDGNANGAVVNANQSARESDAKRQLSLDRLQTAEIDINDATLTVWVADNADTRREGLMWVPAEELANDEGMLFVFPFEQHLGFWMVNTITPLDIAYARLDGTIVKIWQMPVATNAVDAIRTFPSLEPAIFALEMRQGTFARLGIKEGDIIGVPDDIFKSVQ
ncbi:MAG: DUF192 domain-containing protein [Phycisphaerae bacterium]